MIERITEFSEEGNETIRQIIREELNYCYVPCFKCNKPIKLEEGLKIVGGIGIFHRGCKHFCNECVRIILTDYVKSKIKKR